MKYTGIRCKYDLRYNAFVMLNTQDGESAAAEAKENLRGLIKPADFDALAPWEVKVIPASWGFPPRVMVTF